MADRLPQSSYPLVQNFNPSMLQQQHNQQQPQPNQSNQLTQNQHQMQQQLQELQQGQVPNMSMQDNARLWQQMQQQFPQFRGSAQGMDTTNQMADLFRNRALNQMQQQQQQQQQQHQQQQFTLGVNQLGANPPHQPPFHDQSGGQPNMPPGFPNMGLGNNMASGNVAALRALQARQLGLISMAQNQQNQNAPAPALMAHMQAMHREQQHQREQQMQGSQSDIFANSSMNTPDGIRRSPPHASPQPPPGAMPPNMPQNPDGSQPPGNLPTRRMMTLAELRERANQVRTMITAAEQALMQLSANRAALQEQTYMQKMQALQNDLKSKQDYFTKLSAAIHLQAQGANQPQFQGMGGMPPAQFPHPGQTNGWMNHQSNGNPASFGAQPGPHSNTGPGGLQQSPANLHAQANRLLANGGVPPRSGPTPTQQQREQMQKEQQQREPHRLGAPFGQISPPPNQSFGFGVPGGSSNPANTNPVPNTTATTGATPNTNGMQPPSHFLSMLPPLAKPRFDEAYANFCRSKGIQHDHRLMSLEGRPIDLHNLHRQVLMEGGSGMVAQKELWAVIGARMGFVAFQASETEPAKSGPQIAMQLAHIYKEYLSAFDSVYIASVIDQKRRQMQHQMNPATAPPAEAGGPGAHVNPPRGLDAAQMQQMIQYASLSAAELRARGVDERVIQFVERHRANLQRTTAGQIQFREQLRPGVPPQGSLGPNGMNVGPPLGMPGNGDADGPNHLANGPSFTNSPARSNTPMARPAMPMGSSGLPMGGMPTGTNIGLLVMRSDPHLTNTALKLINQLKEAIPTQMEQLVTATASVPSDQRVAYNLLIEQVFRASQEFDSKLPMFFVLLRNDEMIKKLVAINYTIATQRTLLASNQPRFVIGLDNLRSMAAELAKAKEIFQTALNTIKSRQLGNGAGPSGPPPPGPSAPGPSQTMPSNMQQSPSQPPQPIPAAASFNRPPITQQQRMLPQPPKPKPAIQPSPSTSSMTVPTPPATLPANASTPVASASSPLPSTNSPQGPKSPKPKGSQKSKVPPNTQAKGRRPSKVGQGSPVPAAAEPPRPPSTSAGVKRPREEDTAPSGSSSSASPKHPIQAAASSSSGVASEASPPKRMKTEWDATDGPILDDHSTKQASESITTHEDASNFIDSIAELIKLAVVDGQTSITSGISDTLEEILKGYGGAPDGDPSLGALESNHPSGSEIPPSSTDNEFEEFFNFASFDNGDDDAGSKAATPDLILSSSANTSPESNAETDAAHHLGSDVKTEDVPDPLRMGIWKEIDGGESSFYHTHDFKWDAPMPSSVEWQVLS